MSSSRDYRPRRARFAPLQIKIFKKERVAGEDDNIPASKAPREHKQAA